MKNSPLGLRNGGGYNGSVKMDADKNGNTATNGSALSTEAQGSVASPSKSSFPPGISELVDESFVPGVNGYFEKKPSLPILKSTRNVCMKNKHTASKTEGTAGNEKKSLKG